MELVGCHYNASVVYSHEAHFILQIPLSHWGNGFRFVQKRITLMTSSDYMDQCRNRQKGFLVKQTSFKMVYGEVHIIFPTLCKRAKCS